MPETFLKRHGIYNTDSPCSRLRCYLCKGSMASLLPFGVTRRSDFGRGIQASLWDAVRTIANPAINRRATVVRPSGTKLSKMSKLQKLLSKQLATGDLLIRRGG